LWPSTFTHHSELSHCFIKLYIFLFLCLGLLVRRLTVIVPFSRTSQQSLILINTSCIIRFIRPYVLTGGGGMHQSHSRTYETLSVPALTLDIACTWPHDTHVYTLRAARSYH
jgi:hypothetical protein